VRRCLVDAVSRRTLEGLQNLLDGKYVSCSITQRRKEQMNVLGHDHCRVKQIFLAMIM